MISFFNINHERILVLKNKNMQHMRDRYEKIINGNLIRKHRINYQNDIIQAIANNLATAVTEIRTNGVEHYKTNILKNHWNTFLTARVLPNTIYLRDKIANVIRLHIAINNNQQPHDFDAICDLIDVYSSLDIATIDLCAMKFFWPSQAKYISAEKFSIAFGKNTKADDIINEITLDINTNNKTSFVFVINYDNTGIAPGTSSSRSTPNAAHWIAVHLNIAHKKIYFFDPYYSEPETETLDRPAIRFFMAEIIEHLEINSENFTKIFYNDPLQKDPNNCGVYVLAFIYEVIIGQQKYETFSDLFLYNQNFDISFLEKNVKIVEEIDATNNIDQHTILAVIRTLINVAMFSKSKNHGIIYFYRILFSCYLITTENFIGIKLPKNYITKVGLRLLIGSPNDQYYFKNVTVSTTNAAEIDLDSLLINV